MRPQKSPRLIWITLVCLLLAATASFAADPPKPFGPVPNARQLQWHQLELYGFLHFGVNTFTGRQWGLGNEPESIFNPTDFDADQIVASAKAGGLKGLILTCKHHDGFCLWPTKYTEHCVRNSPWKDGKGDVVKEISEACARQGLKFGVYLSPWDRNNAAYGTPEYLTYYRNELTELMTNYGPLFEVWFDGANGGTGFYGGKTQQTRKIDGKTYYDWPDIMKIVREKQPNAVVFGDSEYGADVRWVGNENGYAKDPSWETLNSHAAGLRSSKNKDPLTHGDDHGDIWVPAECDVSITRPHWFYDPADDNKVLSPETLVDIYYRSVGLGASMLLNIPPDRRGQIPDVYVDHLKAFHDIIEKTFADNLAKDAKVTASNIRGSDPAFAAENVLAGKPDAYWSTDDIVTSADLTFDLGKPVTFDVIDIREYLPLGQRVRHWSVQAWENGQWASVADADSIGARRLFRCDSVTTDKVRLHVQGPVCPAISEFGLYARPSDDAADRPGSKQPAGSPKAEKKLLGN